MDEKKKQFWLNEKSRVEQDILNDTKKYTAVMTAQLKYLKELDIEIEQAKNDRS